MLPTLSTATPESRIASLVAFMDSASPFYDYRVCSMCGIPRIVLFGEAADYRKLVDVSRKLSVAFKEHLDEYFKNLIPVLEEIAETAEGKSNDQNFWNELYKHEDGSGGPTFAGWISAFLWYVNSVDHKTNTKTLVVKYKGHYDWNKIQYGGISSGSEPSHLSSVPFVWNYFGTEIPMTFVAGILAVEEAEGALTPVLSYGVLNQAKTK
ncbi:MAG: DUF4419 domain-containing protein [Candidatus Vogelbacteria bacterium]|nr:DUF4419 domain-containing protein [Candidatus Vogelbacteria bacterium]